jgi:tetratricopeptide (TPR) repeat protein
VIHDLTCAWGLAQPRRHTHSLAHSHAHYSHALHGYTTHYLQLYIMSAVDQDLRQQADALFKSGKHEDALHLYQQLTTSLTHSPSHSVLANMSACYTHTQQFQRAEEAAREALSLKPGFVKVRTDVCVCVCVCVCTCIYMCVYTCTCIYMCVYVCVCVV